MKADEIIKIRVTKDFKEKVIKASKSDGLSMSSFIKSKLLKIIK